jgi:hypothetical protein
MRAFKSVDSVIRSLRSRKSAETRIIKGARQQIANARGFNFNRVVVEEVVRISELRIAAAQQEIARLDARIAQLKQQQVQSDWIQVRPDPAPHAEY